MITSPLSAPAPDPGFLLLWDMTVHALVSITGIDTLVSDDIMGNVWFGLANQIGNSAPAQLHLIPGTWVGNTTGPAPGIPPPGWVPLATGTLTVGGFLQNSTAVLSALVNLTPGNYGLALTIGPTTAGPNPLGRLHPVIMNPLRIPASPVAATDQFLTLGNATVQQVAWDSGLPITGRSANVEVHYAPAANGAWSTRFGAGCYHEPEAFYEQFTPGTFDLGGVGMLLTPVGGHYLATAASPTIVTPVIPLPGVVGTPGMADDDLSLPQLLPFVFTAPGGVSTNQVVVGSNGVVFLDAAANNPFGYWTPTTRWLDDVASFAVALGDWDPSNPGSLPNVGVFFDTDPANQFVRITWFNVPETFFPNLTGVCTAQIELHASGQVVLRYGTVTQAAAPILVGYHPGDHDDPGGRDLAIGGVVQGYLSGRGVVPPVLDLQARPVMGQLATLVTSNVAPGTPGCLLVLSLGSTPATSLLPFGLPGCSSFLALPAAASVFGPVVAGAHTVGLGVIPNQPAWLGYQIYAQAAPLTPGLNSANVITSNAVCIHVGL